LTNSDLKIYIK